MNIRINGRTSPALNEVIEDRLFAALGQHESWVEQVDVRLWDENGPKGGEDQRCRFDIRLRHGGTVTIEEAGHDPYSIVSLAADRAKQAVGRKVDKLRERDATPTVATLEDSAGNPERRDHQSD